jgi:hypothetical protein
LKRKIRRKEKFSKNAAFPSTFVALMLVHKERKEGLHFGTQIIQSISGDSGIRIVG